MADLTIKVTRFETPAACLAVDWFQVVAIVKHALCVHIHLKTGEYLTVRATDAEQNDVQFDALYSHWEHAVMSTIPK
jgi:hypothetical protein